MASPSRSTRRSGTAPHRPCASRRTTMPTRARRACGTGWPLEPWGTDVIRVKFLARYAELVGREELEVPLPEPPTVAEVVRRARDQLPAARQLPPHPLTAVNFHQVRLDARVQDGDEVALLPPLAGG